MGKHDAWAQRKTLVDGREDTPNFQESQIWRAAVGLNVGTEMAGRGQRFWRPVLIVRKFNHNLFYGVPLTTRNKTSPYQIPVMLKGVERFVIISQLRTLDAKRLEQYMADLSPGDFEKVLLALRKLLAPR